MINNGALVGDTATLRGQAIIDNASLVFDQAATGTYTGGIGGTGSLTKTGSGTLVLSGVDTYGGGTSVVAARCRWMDRWWGAVSVSSGATLGRGRHRRSRDGRIGAAR